MDWVLVDAPCSGTGTLRRNPDMKWKFSKEMLSSLVQEQQQIVQKALSFVRPGGFFVYATCSLLREENEEQLEFFLQKYSLTLLKTFQSLPTKTMDGFFAVCCKKEVPCR
jgi:16S rRNA (cytosine967-C5)-methyltransferase